MRKKTFSIFDNTFVVLLGLLFFFLIGCASRGPVTVKPPTVGVNYFNSTLITPRVVQFKAKILIHNRGKDTLDFERVDYAVDLFQEELFHDSFKGMKKMSKRGTQTVTFPFQIAMSDIFDQEVAVLAEEQIEVTFRGIAYPDTRSGFSPLPFRKTVSIPLPRIPKIAFAGTEGVPFGKRFLLELKLKNTNIFPVEIAEINTHMEINGVKYNLLQTGEQTLIESGSWEKIALRMENTTGKTVSMILNTVKSPAPDFRLGGDIKCKSPYGWIVVPVAIQIIKGKELMETSTSR